MVKEERDMLKLTMIVAMLVVVGLAAWSVTSSLEEGRQVQERIRTNEASRTSAAEPTKTEIKTEEPKAWVLDAKDLVRRPESTRPVEIRTETKPVREERQTEVRVARTEKVKVKEPYLTPAQKAEQAVKEFPAVYGMDRSGLLVHYAKWSGMPFDQKKKLADLARTAYQEIGVYGDIKILDCTDKEEVGLVVGNRLLIGDDLERHRHPGTAKQLSPYMRPR